MRGEDGGVTIIKVRRGLNGHKYAACKADGTFICNFDRLSDVRKHWETEIKWGRVQLVRELDKQADMKAIEETKKIIEGILKTYAMGGRKNGTKERKGNKANQGAESSDQQGGAGSKQMAGAQ